MHVHIDFARIEFDEQRSHRMTAGMQKVGVAAAQRAEQHLVAHRAAVHEEILGERVAARESRQADQAFEPHAFAFRLHRHHVGARLAAHDIRQPRSEPFAAHVARGELQLAVLGDNGEGNIGTRQREPTHGFDHGGGFGALGFQELQARGRREEKIAHLDARTFRERSRAQRRLIPAIHTHFERIFGTARAADDGKMRDRADGRQRLAAKAERRNVQQIVAVELRGGVALHCEREIVRAHTGTVVGDADQFAAATGNDDLNLARPCVERILHKLLHDRGRALDDFAGGNAVDEGFGKLADGHGFSRLAGGAILQAQRRLRESIERRAAAAALDFRAALLALDAALLRGQRRPRLAAMFRRDGRTAEDFNQPRAGVLAVALLRAEAIREQNDHALIGEALARELRRARL